MLSIAFLGAGNIAQAIMGGLIESEDDYEITAFDPMEACRNAATELGVSVADGNVEAIANADIIMLCVKPGVVLDVADEICADLKGQLIVSVAAGITTGSLKEHLPADTHVVRCMPNTPALVGAGMTVLYAGPEVTELEKSHATAVLGAVGAALWVASEQELDAVTAVSGSGPAYFFMMMECMIAAAVEEGLAPDVAKQLVLQTAVGASTMAYQSLHDPATLRQQVTSPGGTTQAAIETFMESGIIDTVKAAVHAARVRSEELSGTIAT